MHRVRLQVASSEKIDNPIDFLDDLEGAGKIIAEFEDENFSTVTASTLDTTDESTILSDQEFNVDILSTLDDPQLSDPGTVVEQVLGTLENPSPSVTLNESIPSLTEAEPLLQIRQQEEPVVAPSLQKILKFAIPAIGVWLCAPILSLIDTSSVGLLSGTAQQAALNPAVAVTDYGGLLIAFMYTGTTNLIASVKEKERDEPTKPKTAKTLVRAMQVSIYVGVILGGTLISLAHPLLRAIIGNDAIDPAVFAAAMRYVRIRGLGMPAAVAIGSAQSACLGLKDVRSPLYVLFAAALVNLIGDIMLVGKKGAWIGGAAGAAWATVFSQYAALGMFVYWLTSSANNTTTNSSLKDRDVVNISRPIMELTGQCERGEQRRLRLRNSLKSFRSSVTKSKESNSVPISSEQKFSARGFLNGRFSLKKLVKFPKAKDIELFKPYFLPVTTTQFGRVSSYIAMSHVVSSALGTASMAANQIILSFFYCLTPIADSLSLTAQSFVPGIFQKKESEERTAAMKKMKTNFMKAGLIFGGVMSTLVGMMPKLGNFFSSDLGVLAEIATVIPALMGVFSVHGIICAQEGLLLGQKDLSFLGKAYASFFFIVPFFMLRVKKAALSGAANIGLRSVWQVFFVYQLVRMTFWVTRTSLLQIRREKTPAVNLDVQQ